MRRMTCGDRGMMGAVGNISMLAMWFRVDRSAGEAKPWYDLEARYRSVFIIDMLIADD